METRKAIQVAAMPTTDNENVSFPPTVVALADDGSIWASSYDFGKGNWDNWERLPGIPQPRHDY